MVSAVLVFILLWTVIGCSSGLILEDFSNSRNENTNFNYVCDTQNVTINFSGLDLIRIKKNFLASPIITCLNLSSNSVQYFDSNAFVNLPGLKFLDISDNNINLNEIFSIGNLNNLEILILDKNKADSDRRYCNNHQYYCSEIKLQTVYPKLKKLFLRNQGMPLVITTDSEAFINYFPSLTHLYLTGSGTRETDFNWLPSTLEYLDLSGHALSSLTLKNLDNLKWLFLDNPMDKYLSTIEIDAKNLIHLQLASNNLKEIHASTFNRMESLLYLDISDNSIDYINGTLFNSMKNLRYLNLSKNHLVSIELNLLDRLSNLKTLVLEKNSITIFPKFRDEIELEELYLNCNNIQSISSGTFAKLRYLKSLYLHDNDLTIIDQDSFNGLEKLKILTLSNNKISTLPINWMIPLTNLEVLDLSNNTIVDLEDLALHDLCPLKYLYLSDQLQYIRSNTLDTVPINLTISLNPKDKFVEKCLKDNKENYRRYD